MEYKEPRPETWPPAITVALPFQPTPVDKTAGMGRRSVWLAASGIACWIGAFAALMIISDLSHDRVNNVPALKAVYLLGVACEWASIWLGKTSRSTRVGKIGLALSIIIFSGMAVVAFYGRAVDDHQEWFWTRLDDDCGCHNMS